MRMQEDAKDLRRRREESGGSGGVKLAARLMPLRKAYPRVNKLALWVGGVFSEGDHGFARVHGVCGEGKKEGNSESWVPARGLREGCPLSLVM